MADHSLSRYIGTFQTKSNQSFGVRFISEKDTKSISEIMQDAYGFEYLYPKVYDEKKLKETVKNKNNFWLIAESVDGKEPAGIALAEKRNNFSIYVGKLAIKNRFRHQGIARGLGTNSFLAMLKQPEFKTVIRLDSDVRVSQYNSMLTVKALGQFPYAVIPNFNCYGDKRKFHPEYGVPYCDGRLEAAVLFLGPINGFWKKREKKVHLLGNKQVLDMYQIVRKIARRMKKDEVTIEDSYSILPEHYQINRDYYKGIATIEGMLLESTLDNLLDEFYEWNVVEWRIPTTNEGLFSQHLAIDNGFIVTGYDPGSYKEDSHILDTLIMCKFPNGVNQNQFRGMRLTETAKPLASSVIHQIKKLRQKRSLTIMQLH